jgi:hypothetical protein
MRLRPSHTCPLPLHSCSDGHVHEAAGARLLPPVALVMIPWRSSMSLHSNLPPETTSRTARPVARWLRRSALVVASTVVLITACVGIHTIAARPCSLPDPTRYDLACDIPLPAGAAFQRTNTGDYRDLDGTGTQGTWTFSVPPLGCGRAFRLLPEAALRPGLAVRRSGLPLYLRME